LYPLVCFDVTGVESSNSITKELVICITRHFREGIFNLLIFSTDIQKLYIRDVMPAVTKHDESKSLTLKNFYKFV
jgi:hypothetical protein